MPKIDLGKVVGADGAGIPAGGTTGQVLAKKSGADMETEWVNPPAGGSPYNLLDNSDFRNPVNQRGYTVYNTGGYTIDRWLLYFSDWANFTIENGLVFNVGSNGCSFYQRISTKSVKVGEKYTLAYMLDGVISVQEWICEATENESYDIAIGISQGTHTLYWVALYEGSYTADTLPPYVPKGYGVELAECKRYYQEVYCLLDTASAKRLYITIDEMRLTPTVIIEKTGTGEPIVGVRNNKTIDVAVESGFADIKLKLSADL